MVEGIVGDVDRGGGNGEEEERRGEEERVGVMVRWGGSEEL